MFYQIFFNWYKYLSDKRQKQKLIFSLIFTLINALIFTWFMRENEHRVGIRFSEPLIDYILPVADFTWYIFSLTYLHIAIAIILLIQIPVDFIKALQAYNFLLIFRLLSITFVPLDTPVDIIPMKDPIVETLSAYDGFIYKDLFFSGHTATLFLLGLMMKNKFLKIYYWAITSIVAYLLVKQQVHYSIDVMAAPFFAYICFYITQKYWKRKEISHTLII